MTERSWRMVDRDAWQRVQEAGQAGRDAIRLFDERLAQLRAETAACAADAACGDLVAHDAAEERSAAADGDAAEAGSES